MLTCMECSLISPEATDDCGLPTTPFSPPPGEPEEELGGARDSSTLFSSSIASWKGGWDSGEGGVRGWVERVD